MVTSILINEGPGFKCKYGSEAHAFTNSMLLSSGVLMQTETIGSWERGGGREGEGDRKKQMKEEMRSSIRKNTATRLARTRFQWPRAYPRRHLALQSEL